VEEHAVDARALPGAGRPQGCLWAFFFRSFRFRGSKGHELARPIEEDHARPPGPVERP